MQLTEAVAEWKSKSRKMGCVAATKWACDRLDGFTPVRVRRYTSDGEIFEHVVATDGVIVLDLAPYQDDGYNSLL